MGLLSSAAGVAGKSLAEIIKAANSAGVKLDVFEGKKGLELSKIVVPEKSKGVGSSIMKELSDYADSTGQAITLSPSTDFGGSSKKRLTDFYKRFGFVQNKGKNKDFTVSNSMYRNPEVKSNPAAAKGVLDMATPARMARAKEQGFDTDNPVYHGTATDFDEFDPDRALGTQFWSTTDKAAIEGGDVGAAGKGVIKEMYHKIKNPAGWEEYDKFGIDELISRGYDGLALKEGKETTFVAFSPNQYRHIDAVFDPAKASSSNLLASNPAAGVGAGVLGAIGASQSGKTYADYSPANLARLRNNDVGSIQAPQSMAASNIAGLMGSANKVGYDDSLLGMVAPQLPSELMNKIAYNDKRGLMDYAKAYAGLLGF